MRTLILLSVLAIALADQECGENQHYDSCGTMCPVTCENYHDPPFLCVKMCKPGCHCDEGYVETGDGRCVKPEHCPSEANECGENQHYESCGTMCPVTCENYHDPPLVCVLMCNPGCHCDEGYVETGDGRCVKSEHCPSKANEFEKNCVDKPDKGMCLAYVPSWYYDAESQKCHKFIYGGCQGNGNRYYTEQECLEHCAGVQASSDVCSLPAEVGLCRGYFPKYYHNKDTGKCEKFIYGGCGGNENNFNTLEECEQVCDVQATTDTCSLPPETGVCDAYFQRYFFNKNTGRCEKFVYGGCGGNLNNFATLEECQLTCA